MVKRKLLGLILVLVMVTGVLPIGTNVYAATGIYTAQDLSNIRNNLSGSYVLMNDINLSSWGEWTPIGDYSNSFKGIFDGQGHIIKNLRVTGNRQYGGLFGCISSATIKNVGLEGTFIDIINSYQATYAGGICGAGNNTGSTSTITNCYNKGYISAASPSVSSNAGGICGMGSFNISNCYNTGNISSSTSGPVSNYPYSYAGGICGGTYNSNISNCYNTGNLTATSLYAVFAGGICGEITYSCYVKNCYNVGNLPTNNSSSSLIGGICGLNGGAISNCYCLNRYKSSSGTVLTTVQMKNKSSFSGWDFSNVWNVSVNFNNGYPYLRSFGNKGVNFTTDRWSFPNQSTSIPLSIYTRLYGTLQGTKLYLSDSSHGTGGQCYGMAATTATINKSKPSASTFDRAALINVGLNDISSEIGMTAADFIKYGYILQYSEDISNEKNANNNQYTRLYNAVKNFQDGNGEPIVIGIRGNFGSSVDCGHAVYPIRIGDDNQTETQIIVNDSNHPDEEMIITLAKNNGQFTGWSYPLFNGTTWGSQFPNGRIYYSTPAMLLYYVGYYYNEQYGSRFRTLNVSEKPLLENSGMLLSASTMGFSIKTNNLTTQVQNDNYNPEILSPIMIESGENEMCGMYWVKSDNTVSFSGIEITSDISLLGNTSGISINVPAGAEVSLTVSDNNTSIADIATQDNEEFSISYLFEGDNEIVENIQISGTSSGNVQTERTDNVIKLTGTENITIDAEINGETFQQTLVNITESDYATISFVESEVTEVLVSVNGETPIVLSAINVETEYYEISDNIIYSTVKLLNMTFEDEECNAIIALYNEDGGLVDVEIQPIFVPLRQTKDFDFTLSISELPYGDYTQKIFIWAKMETLKRLCSSCEYKFTIENEISEDFE